MTAATLVTRVADQAATVKPLEILLWLLAAPFFVLGWVIGMVVVVAVWFYSALLVGFAAARAAGERAP